MSKLKWKMRYPLMFLAVVVLPFTAAQTCDPAACMASNGQEEILDFTTGNCNTQKCFNEFTLLNYKRMFDKTPKHRPWIQYGFNTDHNFPYMYPVRVGETEEIVCEVSTTIPDMVPKVLRFQLDPPWPPFLQTPTLMRAAFLANGHYYYVLKVVRTLEEGMHKQTVACVMDYQNVNTSNPESNFNATYRHFAFRMPRPTVSRVGAGPTTTRSQVSQGETVTYMCETKDVTFLNDKLFKQTLLVNEGLYKQDLTITAKKVSTATAGVFRRNTVTSTVSFQVSSALKSQFLVTCRARNGELDSAHPFTEVAYPYLTDVGPIIVDHTGRFVAIGASAGALSLMVSGALLYYYQSAHK